MKKDASYWINTLQLSPHPEGGFYTETFKSETFNSPTHKLSSEAEKHSDKAQTAEAHAQRPHASLIYFLLKNKDISAFHKLSGDEIWLYHAGCALTLYLINAQGKLSLKKLGPKVECHENMQVIIPKNTWFAAELNTENNFCLMSCVVAPAFEWKGFELGTKEKLVEEFPQHKSLFTRLCNT